MKAKKIYKYIDDFRFMMICKSAQFNLTALSGPTLKNKRINGVIV